MAKIDLKTFYEHEYVHVNEWEDYVLFTYTRGCQYDSAWDEVTAMARGLICNKTTGDIIARPFPKFHNLGEVEATMLPNLPDEPFTITDKLDGSLGILFFHDGQPYMATKGSFQSEQAKWATEWVRKHADTSKCKDGYTYLFEIIYPENKIVIDYEGLEACILIGVIYNNTGQELPYDTLKYEAQSLGVQVVPQKNGFTSIEDLEAYTKTLPSDKEGFVVTFASGLKVKIKGDEYRKIHALITHMTPLDYWRAWDLDIQHIPEHFLVNVPEELRNLSNFLTDTIQDLHMNLAQEAREALSEIKKELGDGARPKDIALAAKSSYPRRKSLIMDIYNGKQHKLWWKVHQQVRPTENKLPGGFDWDARIKRILEDG